MVAMSDHVADVADVVSAAAAAAVVVVVVVVAVGAVVVVVVLLLVVIMLMLLVFVFVVNCWCNSCRRPPSPLLSSLSPSRVGQLYLLINATGIRYRSPFSC